MAVYVFDLLVGYEKSGVDVAQGKRAKYFALSGIKATHVFTKVPTYGDVKMYKDAGINVESMVVAPFWYAGKNDAIAKINFDEFVNNFVQVFGNVSLKTEIYDDQKFASLYRDGECIVQISCMDGDVSFCDVLYWSNGYVIEREVYSNGLLYTDFYSLDKEENGNRKVVRREYKDSEGYDRLTVIFDKDDVGTYVLEDGRMLTEEQFWDELFKKMQFKEGDVIVVDRPSYMLYIGALLKNKKRAYLAVFLHSSHFNELYGPYGRGLNREYMYFFQCAELIDAFVVSTEMQRLDLIDKLKEYGCSVPDVKVIPASGLEKVRKATMPRKPESIITTCRLDLQKGIEWMIEAVVKAHEKQSNISFDIYGTTPDVAYLTKLKELISRNNADDYVVLKGKMDVSEKYLEYEMFLTASRGESLGLSMMEAVGSGNAMVGLDTKYGSSVFIHSGTNGQAIEVDLAKMIDDDYQDLIVNNLAEAIVNVFSDKLTLEKYHKESYKIAERYLDETIEKQWKEFIVENAKSRV